MFKFLALFLFSSSIFAAAYEGDSGGIFALPVSNEYKSNEYIKKIINFINSDKKRPISVPENIK